MEESHLIFGLHVTAEVGPIEAILRRGKKFQLE